MEDYKERYRKLRNVAFALANEVGRLDNPNNTVWSERNVVPGHVLNMLDDIRRMSRGEEPWEAWPDVEEVEESEHPPRKFQITVVGYEYNPNGADYTPDAYEVVEVAHDRALLEHVEAMERKHQTDHCIEDRSPNSSVKQAGRWVPNPNRVSPAVWSAIPRQGIRTSRESLIADQPHYVRAVHEIRPINVDAVLAKAKVDGAAHADALIAAAEAKVKAASEKAKQEAEAKDKREYERLKAKFGS